MFAGYGERNGGKLNREGIYHSEFPKLIMESGIYV